MKDAVGFARKIRDRLLSAAKYGRYDHRTIFSKIYHDREWGDDESVSGIGSRMVQTEQIRRELPRIIKEYQIGKLFDAPCGDLNWMKHVLAGTEVNYEGGDIVPEIVDLARQNSPSPAFRFRLFDIVTDPFPTADLWLCRDVLFHLSYQNIWSALENFAHSQIEFLLLTTHTADRVVNRDIFNGDFREVDFFKPPLSLPRSIVLDRFRDYADPLPPRDMVLIRRKDLAAHLARLSWL